MTMDITKSVAFTGHRSERIFQVRMLYLYLDIVSQVKRLYSLGYRYFLSGMAEGFDLLAAQAVADLRCFHHRNDYLIDNSEIVLAYWDKQPYGGTYYTVGKARMMNRNIINLYK